jgi:hypothetical protein
LLPSFLVPAHAARRLLLLLLRGNAQERGAACER